MDYDIKDKRFAHVAKDARFRKMPVGQRKVKIDKRFKGMFKDKRFKLKYSVDKRGKPMNFTTNENLKKYYELSDNNSDSENESYDKRVANDSEDSDNGIEEVRKKKNSDKKKKDKFLTADKRFQTSHLENELEEGDQENEGVNKSKTSKSSSKKNMNTSSAGLKNKKKQQMKNPDKLKECTGVKKETAKEDMPKIDSDSDEGSSNEDDSDDDEDLGKPLGNDSGVDFARGEGNIVSSSSSEDEDDTDIEDEDDQQDDSKFDHGWGDGDTNIIALDEATCRLAVCNMDWDRMKAKDIFVLLNSFKPSDGIIKSVKVYPSEYGKERMAEETKHGPRELKEMTIDEDGVSETVEGTSYHREKLREYQLNRLKYFYAVVECDSVQTADGIYKECDGMEYESSATKLDLRFIPDEETFEESDVKSVCTQIPSNYKPQYFLNAALTQTMVELTWDETDHERVNLTSQQFIGNGEDIEDEDLKAYLASSSDEEGPDYSALLGAADDEDDDDESDEDDVADKKINKYKQLLTGIESEEKKKKGDVEMEISWEPGLREATENLVKKKKHGKNKTVWEDYLERKKEKKRQKVEERKKKKDRRVTHSESDEDNNQGKDGDDLQAFSDDDVNVDEDMAAFMAEELDEPKMKKNKSKSDKKKKKKKRGNEETLESSKEKAELALLMMDEEENKKHFNLRDLVQEDGKKKKKKKEQKKTTTATEEEDFKINVDDPRFSAVFDSHLYNIDPSAPEYRKTKGTEAMISEKIKRSSHKNKQKRSDPSVGVHAAKKQKLDEKQPRKDESLATLIKSVKSKTAHFHGNKSKR